MKQALTNIGIVTALVIIGLALIGAKHVAAGTAAAVDAFDIVKIWRSWNWVLTGIQVLFLFAFIYWMNGKKFVIVDKEKEPEQEFELMEDEGDWSFVRKVKESELPTVQEVMTELHQLKGKGNPEFWAQKLREAKVKRYRKARTFCLSQQKAAKARQDKNQQTRNKSYSPTVEWS